tara:strand:+ start:309 stop:623 length:315 start_codon:yes stop_codon:yes gene_type:complete
MSGIINQFGSRSRVLDNDIRADNYGSHSFADDVDYLDKAGFYNVSYAATNNPTGTYNWTYFVSEGASQANVVSQIAIRDTGAIRYTRSRDNSTWSAWRGFSTDD